MREIKFRYVIKYEGDKIQTFKLTLDEIQKHCGAWDEVNIFCENVGLNKYEIIARDQFTGLKDRSENEIYEGDIVKYDWNWEFDGGYALENRMFKKETKKHKPYVGNVSWDIDNVEYAHFVIYPDRINLANKIMLIEVIGNIYETPELLK